MARKVHAGLAVSPSTRNRADAVALITGQSRAEVYRLALESRGLQGLEEAYASEMRVFDAHAARLGMSRLQLAAQMTRDSLRVEDLSDLEEYPK